MQDTSEAALRLTYALLKQHTAVAAAQALRGSTGKAAIEGLVELIYEPPSAQAAVAALRALEIADSPLVGEALTRALTSSHATVRMEALFHLRRRRLTQLEASVSRILREDGSWIVRRAAVGALADAPAPGRWQILAAADDPHWRVRNAMILALLKWGEDPAQRDEIDLRLAQLPDHDRVRGVRAYLAYRRRGLLPRSDEARAIGRAPRAVCPVWDWDSAVLLRNLERLDSAGCRAIMDTLPSLLAHADDRIASFALAKLRDEGEPGHIAQAIAVTDEPRNGAGEVVASLLGALDLDRSDEVAQFILALSRPTAAQRAWAKKMVNGRANSAEALPAPIDSGTIENLVDDPVSEVRMRAAECLLAGKANGNEALLVRLQSDVHPYVRAAALIPDLASQLVKEPCRESSWHVLAKAARMMKVPLWKLEFHPPWEPPVYAVPACDTLQAINTAPLRGRPLGAERFIVSPMGISGHYGLSAEGFVRACESGVNLFFWEPNYQGLTEFMNRLPVAERKLIQLVAGTFEADGKRVRRDVDRVLRMLKIERLPIFLLFWVQSWDRIATDVAQALDDLKTAGKIATYGLSTHSRSLAVEAIERGWNPIMVRHSAAHRGAEEWIFPRALERGTSLITFNNTCYGRLLRSGAQSAFTSADCYRYTLSFSAVTSCWSAPSDLEQLKANLTALKDPELPADRRGQLIAHGNQLYEQDGVFQRLVRSI